MNIRVTGPAVVAVGLMAVVPFSVASADGPVATTSHYEGTDVLVDCGSFRVLDVYSQDETEKAWLDQDGNLLKVIIENTGTDTFTNSVTGTAYPMSFHNTYVVDFTTTPRSGALMGVVYRLVVPGAGAVWLDVGRVVFERGVGIVFQAGPHQFFDGDEAALCAAME